jgi:Rieske Fe-S protein
VSEHGSKATTANAGHGADAPAGETRRDFIHIAAASVAAGGVAAVAWPFIQQLGPAADTRAASSAEVDVSKVPEGSEIRVLIGGMPFFVRRLVLPMPRLALRYVWKDPERSRAEEPRGSEVRVPLDFHDQDFAVRPRDRAHERTIDLRT